MASVSFSVDHRSGCVVLVAWIFPVDHHLIVRLVSAVLSWKKYWQWGGGLTGSLSLHCATLSPLTMHVCLSNYVHICLIHRVHVYLSNTVHVCLTDRIHLYSNNRIHVCSANRIHVCLTNRLHLWLTELKYVWLTDFTCLTESCMFD